MPDACDPFTATATADVGRIAPQSGVGFSLRKGDVLRVTDPCGEQVSDLFAFEMNNLACWLSSGRSIDYASNTQLTTGHILYSNDSRKMFTIVADSVARHDFLLTPCSQQMFRILYGCTEHHPSCFENLSMALRPFGVSDSQIHTTFNIFMNVVVDPDGTLHVKTPTSKAGDHIELRAEMDLWCGLTACAAEGSNNGTFKPIDYLIRRMVLSEHRPPVGCNAPGHQQQPCNGGGTIRALAPHESRRHRRTFTSTVASAAGSP